MSINVSEQAILEALRQVPQERWGAVLEFLDSLRRTQPTDTALPPVRTGKDLVGSDLIGIWADRTDIGDTRECARRLREQAAKRTHEGRPDAP